MAFKQVGVQLVVDGLNNFKSAMQQSQDSIDGIGEKLKGVSTELKVTGAAFTAIGAGSLKLSSDARKLNSELAQTAINLDTDTKSLRNLALATTNVTFPLESVTKTFDALAKAGVKDQKTLKASAIAFDTLGDATRTSGEEMANLLLPAFKLFGEQIPTTSAELDNFTWLTRNTMVSMSDFGTLLTRMAPYMDDLNLSMDDAIVLLAGLDKQGIKGTAATLKLRTAITQAAKSGESLTDILGLTESDLKALNLEMNSATGITEDYAAAANSQFGIMDKLKQKWSEISFQAGSYLQVLEPVSATLTALGPAMIFLSTSIGQNTVKWIANTAAMVANKTATLAVSVATKAYTAAQWLLNAALSANPIGLVIAALAGLAAAVYLVIKNWDKVSAFFQTTWNNIWGFVKDTADKIWSFLKEWGLLLLGVLFPPALVAGAIIKWKDAIIGGIKNTYNFIRDQIYNIVQLFWALPARIANAIKSLPGKIIAPFKQVWEYVKMIIDKIKGAVSSVTDVLTNPLGSAGGVLSSIGSGIAGIFGQYGGTAIKSGRIVGGEHGPEVVSMPAGSSITPVPNNYTYNITENYARPESPQSLDLTFQALSIYART